MTYRWTDGDGVRPAGPPDGRRCPGCGNCGHWQDGGLCDGSGWIVPE